ncbi:MAG: cysteine hydrolase [Brevundimonas sp.]|uniref:cysteine hydrolase n=1 Tax=Brevundimonas sp. TaxID=1871086 RepID=UPI00391AE791
MTAGLRFGPIPTDAVHLCVDMQRLFAEDTGWRTPWMPRVLPAVLRLCAHRPDAIWFTRFIPARSPDAAQGAWARYWRRWPAITLENLDPSLIELVPELQPFAPPGRLLDKATYSPWIDTDLHASLSRAGVDTLVVSGAETDVCVLAAVLGAVDLGYRVIVASDAVCSSSDETHDSLLGLYHQRFGQQIETAATDEIIDAWR